MSSGLPGGIPADIYTQQATEEAVAMAGEAVELAAALLEQAQLKQA